MLKQSELSRDTVDAYNLILTEVELDLLNRLILNDIDRKLRHAVDPTVPQSIFAKIIDLGIHSEERGDESE